MNSKPLFKSKTVVVNSLVIIAAVFTALMNHEIITAYPRAVAWLTAGLGAINVTLRLITTEAINLG